MSARHRPASRRAVLRPVLVSTCLLGIASAPLSAAHAADGPTPLFETTATGGVLVRGGALAAPSSIELPAPDTVRFAVLTWTGAGTGVDRLALTAPGTRTPVSVPAAAGSATDGAYREQADVTALLRSADSGEWTVVPPAGLDDPQATWSLTVAYDDPAAPRRTLQVLADGSGRQGEEPVAWPRPPVTADDAATTHANVPVTIPVLDNDADPTALALTTEGLSVTAVGQPDVGQGRVVTDGRNVTFVPAPTFRTGSATFDYTVADATGAASHARVTVTVVDQGPTPQPDDLVLTGRAGSTWRLDVAANDTDPDGDPLQLVEVTAPRHGTATTTGGEVDYRPAAGFTGRDSFDYVVSDGHGGTARQTVSVTVANRAPRTADDAVAVRAGEPLRVDVLADDADPDGDALHVVALTAPTHGTARLVDGAVVYRSATGFAGSDTVGYQVRDARGATASGTVRVTVVPGSRTAGAATRAVATTPAAGSSVDGSDTSTDGKGTTVTTQSAPARFTGVEVSDQTVGAAPTSEDSTTTSSTTGTTTQSAPDSTAGTDQQTLPNTGGPSAALTGLGGLLVLGGAGLLGTGRRPARRAGPARHRAARRS